jgi:inosine-uridine nucleoside N-ribohydrolase
MKALSSRRKFLEGIGKSVFLRSALLSLMPGRSLGTGIEGDKIPVLFDTDIGTDIDDAICLAYLLAQPRCELLGVTAWHGDDHLRARLASAICRAVGRDGVPIHAGERVTVSGEPIKQGVLYDEPLSRWPHQEQFEEGTAIDFMYETIRSRPGEVTLLAVGPLTNVGGLFKRYPDAAEKVGQVVLMNGWFKLPLPEYNAPADALATRIVYEAPTPSLTSVGLGVTIKVRMPCDEVHERFAGGPFDVVADMLGPWMERVPFVIFHDPLATAIIFEPDICRYKKVMVKPRRGVTLVDRLARKKPHTVAVSVDRERFFDHYFSVFSPPG